MANYYARAVHYGLNHDAIARLKGTDKDDYSFEYSRDEVIRKIGVGYIFYTTVKNSRTGKLEPGEQIQVVTVNGEKWLKTKNNNTPKDNLENLPEY